jgi:hypothetical protein
MVESLTAHLNLPGGKTLNIHRVVHMYTFCPY